MIAKPKDQRPRVISFSPYLDGLNIAAKADVLWPCHAFSTSIPQKKKSSLNVFEETILRITEVETGSTERIASSTCLDKELVSFVQNRLNQLGLLDDRYQISKEGQELLNTWGNNSEGNLEYTVATFLVDLLSGRLLPFVNTDQLRYKQILAIDNDIIEFAINPNKKKRAKQILPARESHWDKPNINDVIRAIKEYKRRYKRYALLNQGVDQLPPPVPKSEAISVHDEPELVYLHCQAIVQEGNTDILVTDGFGFGFSDNFASYLTSQNWGWVINLKEQGKIDRIETKENQGNTNSNKSYKYNEISRRIKKTEESLSKIRDIKPTSSNYEQEYRKEIEFGVKNLYESIEWSLRHVVSNFPVSEWETVFSSQNFKDNEKLLHTLAMKIGFSVAEKDQSLLQLKAGAVRQIEQGKVELQPLLALSIVGAAYYSDHPMNSLAKIYPGFIGFAKELKSYRDPIEHGSTNRLVLDRNTLEGLRKETVKVLISLIPGIADDLDEPNEILSGEDINQDRLKASIALDKAFGTSFASDFSPDIKEQLIRSEIMLTHFSDDKAIEIIKCYASTLQQSLFEAVKDRRLNNDYMQVKEAAIQKVVHLGFYSDITAIPKEISSVNAERINLSVSGSSTTLGANLLAVFLLGEKAELEQLRISDPAFVDFVANLIRLRGHGNQLRTNFSIELMRSLKDDVYKVIKKIKEIF